MFKNYLKITFRNLIKHKSYTFINISGLALGIACTILILAYIGFELSYDKFHENHENIYRAAVSGKIAGRYIEAASVPAPFGPTIIQDYPEVLDAVRFRTTGQRMFSYQDKKFYENDLIFADNSILSVFSFELLKGDPETALKTGYSLIITPEIAEKYFGNEDPIGKILKMNNDNEYTVTGIVKEPPGNTHFTFSMIASFETLYKSNPRLGGAWFNFNYQTYILLRDGIDHKEFESKINEFLEKYLGAMMKAMGAEDFKGFLQPLPSIHLHSNLEEGEFGNNGDIKYVYAFLAIAVFILMIACINFMNLSTARSANRAKEVGLRKVHGAERRNLIIQFLGESIIFSIISLGIALVLVQLASPYFNSLAGQEIDINYLNSPLLFSSLFIIVIFVGIAAGSYPAFFLSGFKPSQVLKGDIQQGAKHSRFRSILVVSQFAISIALIIGTAIIYNQVDYLKNKNLGFNKEQLLVLKIQDNETRSKAETIKNEMTGFDGVISAAASTMVPGEENLNNSVYFPEGMGEDQGMLMDNFNIDHEFINTYEIEILKGREFSKDITTDTENGVLINETTIRALGWDDPIGRQIFSLNSPTDPNDRRAYNVVGVYRDFNHRSLYKQINPTIIYCSDRFSNRLTLRLKTENISQTMRLIEEKWRQFDPNHPYEYFFLDESFDSLYRAEERLASIFTSFSMFAVFIGCLGLFGLASFTAEQRTKEIGIRKALGSSVNSIIMLLCREFIRLIVIANLVAWPVAYFVMNQWMNNFPYSAGIGIPVFIIAAVLALMIAIMTVSYQSVKAAYTNPVKALRYQ